MKTKKEKIILTRKSIEFRIWSYSNQEYMEKEPYDDSGRESLWKSKSLLVDLQFAIDTPQDFRVQQWTGLKDKSGKKIFEGDILNNPFFPNKDDEGYERMIVRYDEDSASFEGDFFSQYGGEGNTSGEQRISDYTRKEYGCYVVGNIFENPELLNS